MLRINIIFSLHIYISVQQKYNPCVSANVARRFGEQIFCSSKQTSFLSPSTATVYTHADIYNIYAYTYMVLMSFNESHICKDTRACTFVSLGARARATLFVNSLLYFPLFYFSSIYTQLQIYI